MSLVHSNEIKNKLTMDFSQDSKFIYLDFYSNNKYKTEELIDSYKFRVEDLLEILQKHCNEIVNE